MRTIGDNVAAVMQDRGLDRAALAKYFEVGEGQAGKYLSASNVELKTLFRLAKFLGASIESLCEGIDPDYDAMRARVRTPEQFVEYYLRIADQKHREALWVLIQGMAGVRSDADDSTPPPSP